MKLFKLILAGLLIMVLGATTVYADVPNENVQTYLSLNNTLTDASGNGNTFTDDSSINTGVGCVIDDCRDYNGAGQSIFRNGYNIGGSDASANFSISMWAQSDVEQLNGDFDLLFRWGTSGGLDSAFCYFSGPGVATMECTTETSAGAGIGTVSRVGQLGTTLHHYVLTISNPDSEMKLYVDGVLEDTTALSGTAGLNNNGIFRFADRSFGAAEAFDGTQDEIAIFNTTLNLSQVIELNNSGAGLHFPFPITQNVITTNLKAGYNVSNITVQVNATILTNLSFSLDGANQTSICSSCVTGNTTISGLLEGNHNITWFTLTSNLTETFDIDTVVPNINVSLPAIHNSYFINFTQFIQFSDKNLDSCILAISQEGTTPCINQSFEFNFNGNHTINVTVNDTAGNVNRSLNNLILINPEQFFRFTNNTGGFINNFTFGGQLFSGNVANISTYFSLISLGNNSLIFSKGGFANTNINFTLNTTSRINLTTNITASQIVLKIFDRETLQLVTGLTTITMVAPVGFNGSTTTGLLNISSINFLSGTYQIIAENADYNTESIFFTYNNQETLVKEIFMLKSNATDVGTVTVQVTASTGPFVQGAVCQALEWKPSQSAFISVAEGNTNTEGSTILNIEIGTKLYKFTCTKSGITVTSPQNIVQVSGATIPLVLDIGASAPVLLLNNFIYNLTNSTLNATHQQITYKFNSQDNLVTEACLKVYTINGNNRALSENPTCVSASNGEIQIIVDVDEDFSQKVVATAEQGGVVREVDEISFLGSFSLENSLSTYGMQVLVPLLFLVGGLVLGLMIKPASITISLVSMFIFMWLGFTLIPSIMSLSSTIFVSVMFILMIWGSFRR